VQGFNFDINPRYHVFENLKLKKHPVLVFGRKLQNQRAFWFMLLQNSKNFMKDLSKNYWILCQWFGAVFDKLSNGPN
jgi:hypothetical protein